MKITMKSRISEGKTFGMFLLESTLEQVDKWLQTNHRFILDEDCKNFIKENFRKNRLKDKIFMRNQYRINKEASLKSSGYFGSDELMSNNYQNRVVQQHILGKLLCGI